MPDAIFADPRLAKIYDAFDGPRLDLDLYLGIAAEVEARSVLDVGCGTGSLAVLLASSGRTVIGVDPALASLEIARAKDSRVTWIHGDATTLPQLSVDLATMTGNVAQVFLGDDWEATLRGVHGALRPGGHFAFETRRPEERAWEDWARVKPRVLVGVREQFDLLDVSLPFVSFRHTYGFPDGSVITSDSTLRFRSRAEVTHSLVRCGFEVVDVRDAPDRPGREHVFLARKVS
ncbi:Methyltransferase domain-containing protein [Lentzea albidocapillata subsp. violacea]|uniref:Methyltransferase domain-containing protein n=1 Tax=Lentzea albidocapillata subsp. violacea TaxID=128104 RepID=A0A1G8ZW59_9PSEU|nr:class I SAM-dependent methyltransferase [Lentzea albidocapillata]SDK18360.1 Methyltransferase domain-containing protein [Lentzea albidocapillata subsp. violacea]